MTLKRFKLIFVCTGTIILNSGFSQKNPVGRYHFTERICCFVLSGKDFFDFEFTKDSTFKYFYLHDDCNGSQDSLLINGKWIIERDTIRLIPKGVLKDSLGIMNCFIKKRVLSIYSGKANSKKLFADMKKFNGRINRIAKRKRFPFVYFTRKREWDCF